MHDHANTSPERERGLHFRKVRRAQSIHDFETWQEDNVTNTINPFDTGDIRATDIVIHPIQATVIGRSDEAGPQGRGFGDDDDPMLTLNTADRHAVAVYEPRSAFEENWAESDIKNALRAEASKSSHAVVANPVAFNWQNGGGCGNANPGLGITEDGTGPLSRSQTPAISYNIYGGNPRPDRPEGGFYVNETDTTKTLDASSGLNPSANQGGTAIVTSTVRRLTPRECERLQGFPDDWTAERFDYKKQQVVPQADSARYKQMGNAVAVPVFEWVISRIVAVDSLRETA